MHSIVNGRLWCLYCGMVESNYRGIRWLTCIIEIVLGSRMIMGDAAACDGWRNSGGNYWCTHSDWTMSRLKGGDYRLGRGRMFR